MVGSLSSDDSMALVASLNNGNRPSLPSSDQSAHSTTSSVDFGTVEVREYERICGDHPDVHDPHRGPPLAIGWRFAENQVMSLDSFEETRKHGRSASFGPMNGEMRKNILKHGFQVSESECQANMKESIKCKKLREKTNKQSKFGERVEGLILSVTRKGRWSKRWHWHEPQTNHTTDPRSTEGHTMVPLKPKACQDSFGFLKSELTTIQKTCTTKTCSYDQ